MQIVKITIEDTELLKQFISSAGKSLNAFRYFNLRPIECITNHVCTYIIVDNELPVAYGHLDREDDTIWLGIAVIANLTGKGYGKLMMAHLIDFAKHENIKAIKLSVDNDNINAIVLYKKYGFTLLEQKEKFSFYTLTI